MSFIKSLSRQKGKGSFSSAKDGRDPSLAQTKSGLLLDLDGSQLDLLTVLTYLSCISTANVTREQLFEAGARLGYMPSPYFAQVANLVQSLGYDFSHACHVVSETCPDDVMKQFLLRMGNSMASGEAEPTFLMRETAVQMEDYTNAYERDVETLRKWTDAFVALMVSCNLVVLVSLISNMIYNLGVMFIVIVTGQRPDNGLARYGPGDLRIMTNAGTYGLELGGGAGGGAGTMLVGGEAGSTYTLDSNGFTTAHSTAAAGQTAGSLWLNPSWILDPIVPQEQTQMQIGGGGSHVGDATFRFTRNTVTTQHAIIELSIPFSLFGGETIQSITWHPACGNDVLSLSTQIVPEPGAVALAAMAAAAFVPALVRRRTARAQRRA